MAENDRGVSILMSVPTTTCACNGASKVPHRAIFDYLAKIALRGFGSGTEFATFFSYLAGVSNRRYVISSASTPVAIQEICHETAPHCGKCNVWLGDASGSFPPVSDVRARWRCIHCYRDLRW